MPLQIMASGQQECAVSLGEREGELGMSPPPAAAFQGHEAAGSAWASDTFGYTSPGLSASTPLPLTAASLF